MHISAKGRYALAALLEIARQKKYGELVSVVSISDKLGISKIFLEQAVSQLKKGGLVQSTKGAKGGYQLAREPQSITALDVLTLMESALFETTDATVAEREPAMEAALRDKVFDKLDTAVTCCLADVTVQELLEYADQQNGEQAFMLYM